jgi:hypothetical protein
MRVGRTLGFNVGAAHASPRLWSTAVQPGLALAQEAGVGTRAVKLERHDAGCEAELRQLREPPNPSAVREFPAASARGRDFRDMLVVALREVHGRLAQVADAFGDPGIAQGVHNAHEGQVPRRRIRPRVRRHITGATVEYAFPAG